MQREERASGVVGVAPIVYECLVAPDDLGRIAAHHPGGALVFRDRQQVRTTRRDRVVQVGQAFTCHHVLIDGGASQIPKTFQVLRVIHDAVVVRRGTPHQIAAEDAGAGGGPTHHTTACQHRLEGALTLVPPYEFTRR